MAKSINLKNNIYWDVNSIMNAASKIDFNIPNNSSVNLNFDGAELILLFCAKTTLGMGTKISFIYTYGEGTTSRTGIETIKDYQYLVLTIDGKKITVTNNSGSRFKCSLLFLIGNKSNVSIN